MIAAALWLSAQQAPIAPPPIVTIRDRTDAEYCAMANDLTAKIQPELPKMVDANTRLDGFVALCAVPTLTWNKTILAPSTAMREGWQGRKQSQWNEVICGNADFLMMYRRNWNFTQNLTFRDGVRVIMHAKCG